MAGALNPTDKCLLHVPHMNVGKDIVRKIEMDPEPPLMKVGMGLEANFREVERWVDRFYKECICDCAGGGEG